MKTVGVFFQEEGEEEVRELSRVPAVGEKIVLEASEDYVESAKYDKIHAHTVQDVLHYPSNLEGEIDARVYVRSRK